ncbi:MAG: hypothetical protein NC110_05465 [Ruminococcus sp.]|nr:hypothetical protein [Ruminococcus sp.]
MPRVRVKTFSGVVCEQEIFTVSDRVKDAKKAPERLRFKTEEEREAHRAGISRRKHIRLVNENFSPRSLYSTLTFDNENEVHTFDEARHIRDLFFRRLKYKYTDAVIFIYMGRGKSTHRIHFHMISDGVPEEYIRKQWIYGEIVDVKPLREHNLYKNEVTGKMQDYGQDYTGLANYLFDHWTPEQGGHRWKQTRNTRKPDREEPEIIKRKYSENKPPKTPKGYILVETEVTKYGYMRFKYVIEPPKISKKKADSG